MPTGDEIRAVVDDYVARMSASDKEGWLALFSDDARIEDPVGQPVHEGRAAIAAFWDLVQGMADGMWLELTGPVRVAGSECAFPMRAHSQVGDARLVVDIIDVFGFDDQGSITSVRAFWNADEMRPDD